jgi:membrane protease YdiL (CAAX protease family)
MMIIEKTSRPSLIHRFPIISFFALAWVLGAVVVSIAFWGELPSEFALSSVFSSSFAGILMTAVLDRKSGLKLMFSRLLIWRVGIGYWLFALFFILMAVIIGSLFNPLFQGDSLSLQQLKPAFNIPLMFFGFFIVSGIGQELGWTGFLITRLQARVNAITACIIRAILDSIWHLPVFIYSMVQPQALIDFQYAGWIAQKGFLVALLAATFLFMLPWSIFISWIFNNTKGSLLLVSVLHGSEIWVAYWMMSAGIYPGNLDNYWGYGAVMILSSIMIVAINGSKNFSRKYERIINQS